MEVENIKWWQKIVRGWVVPKWFSDTPLFSRRFYKLTKKEKDKISDKVRKIK
jgi:hypothetical protein